jgi:hypothetical protein
VCVVGVEMMDEEGFMKFLKRGGRSQDVVYNVVMLVKEFEGYLKKRRSGADLDTVRPDDVEAFVSMLEHEKKSGKGYLWAIRYYFKYTSNAALLDLATKLRQGKIEKAPFKLKEFRGVNPKYVKKLEAIGISNIVEMIDAGRTPSERKKLAEKVGVPVDVVLEFVKLSDLARLPGLKGIRARLYYDAGVDTVEKLAQRNPEELRAMLAKFVEEAHFQGIAPLPKEVESQVEAAKKLSKIVQF